MYSSYWTQPRFLWAMSIVLPIAVVPIAMLQEAIADSSLGNLMGERATANYFEGADLKSGEVTSWIAWLVVPILYSALHLWRYRGGATILPFAGRGWFSAFLAIVSLFVSGLFLFVCVVGTGLPELQGIPFALWLVIVAIYCQALRAAAVRRSLSKSEAAPDELTKIFG